MKKVAQFLKKMHALTKNSGFTMIELLIVIAILGILAVAVLSAINPVEQINRGRDTGSRSDAEQLLSAIDRYNAFAGYYPWQAVSDDPTTLGLAGDLLEWDDSADVEDTAGCSVSEKLSTGSVGCTGSDELKVTFFTRIFETSYNHLFIYNSGDPGASTYVCYPPRSKAFIDEANKRCIDDTGSGLPADMAAIRDTVCGDVTAPMVCLP